MMWEKCEAKQFCRFVYLKDNFTQLCQIQITFQKASDAVKNLLSKMRQPLNCYVSYSLSVCLHRFISKSLCVY